MKVRLAQSIIHIILKVTEVSFVAIREPLLFVFGQSIIRLEGSGAIARSEVINNLNGEG